ncbi:MAG: hypothetical protein E7292_09680 [Lachnospiraceae bacterium]|nr:hypothetical protein [Lachnospiraceae bacterium]
MHKRKKIIMVSVIIIVVLGSSIMLAMLALGLIDNDKPIYGEFIYMNDDGTDAKVILSEDSVYFENVDFSGMEEVAATFAAVDELKAAGIDYTMDDVDVYRLPYLEAADFNAFYNGKEHSFDRVQYIEEEKLYFYYVDYPNMGERGVDICVDLNEKILIIGEMGFQPVK